MNIYRKLPLNIGPSVATIGNFDGVHLGHQWVINEVVARSRELNCASLAITFDPHPARVLRPESRLSLITPLDQKLELLSATGIENVVVIPFTEEFSKLSPRDFASHILCDACNIRELHEGENFRFGYQAEAGITNLEALGRELGFNVRVYAPRILRKAPISSSRIRKLIAAGDVSHARALLGRSYTIIGSPAAGRGYGTRYTVPTINLAPYAELLPATGVYITTITIGEETFQSVTNVGNRPTFESEFTHNPVTVETHILNFHPIELTEDTLLYLSFLKRLRAEQKFPTPEALREQIGRDVRHAQRYFTVCQAVASKSPSGPR